MADNVGMPLTGTGADATASVATDDVSGAHFQKIKIADGAADSSAMIGGDATNGLDVDVTRVIPGTAATALGKAVDSAAGATDTGVAALAVRDDSLTTLTPAESDYVPLRTTSTGALWVSVSGTPSVAASVTGSENHGTTDDESAPVKVGGVARVANPAAVDGGDRVDATFDDIGRQVVVLNQVRDLTVHQATTITNSISETTILTAAASTYHDLTQLVITNASATACTVAIKDDTGGTTRMTIALAANGDAVLSFPVPVTASATNDNWTATLSVNTVTVHFFVQAVKNV